MGKSTLLNRLVREKLAAMSRRPQTTRNKITGICHGEAGPPILMDTPGIHKGSRKLNEAMVQTSMNTFRDVDLILFMIDARQKFTEEDEYVLESLKPIQVPKVLVLNKIDLVAKADLLKLIQEVNAKAEFADSVPISALEEDGLDILQSVVMGYLPEGPEYFPKDMITDCPEVVESMKEGKKPGVLVIDATIYVERASQKKIVIGEKANLLKKIGSQARGDIELRFGDKIYLNLFVKVKERWRDNLRSLKEFGYTHGHN